MAVKNWVKLSEEEKGGLTPWEEEIVKPVAIEEPPAPERHGIAMSFRKGEGVKPVIPRPRIQPVAIAPCPALR